VTNFGSKPYFTNIELTTTVMRDATYISGTSQEFSSFTYSLEIGMFICVFIVVFAGIIGIFLNCTSLAKNRSLISIFTATFAFLWMALCIVLVAFENF
jgi:hypothetical protein